MRSNLWVQIDTEESSHGTNTMLTEVLNTQTGVLIRVRTMYEEQTMSVVFVPGENWDRVNGFYELYHRPKAVREDSRG